MLPVAQPIRRCASVPNVSSMPRSQDHFEAAPIQQTSRLPITLPHPRQGHAPLLPILGMRGQTISESELGVSAAEILRRVTDARQHAMKNQALGNLSGRYFAGNVLCNGVWSVASNLELAGDCTFCGERSAVIMAWNQAMSKIPMAKLHDAAYLEQLRQQLKIRMIVIDAAHTRLGETSGTIACCECQSWFGTEKYFSPATWIVGVRREAGGPYAIYARQVRDLFPHRELQRVSQSAVVAHELVCDISPEAEQRMSELGIKSEQLTALYEQARQLNAEDRAHNSSRKVSSAAVMFNDGTAHTATRFEYADRWYLSPDLRAVADGVENGKRPLAIAYCGTPGPETRSLGMLVQPYRAGRQVLIVTCSGDKMYVRCIVGEDAMLGEVYISSRGGAPVRPV